MSPPARTLLTFDFGSSHFKARVYRGRRAVSPLVQVALRTRTVGNSVEILPHAVEKAFMELIRPLRQYFFDIDAIICSNQAPSLCLLDKHGHLSFPVITHLDRRSSTEARDLLSEFGEAYLLSTTKNLPVPGGIASTSLRWLRAHYGRILQRADSIGSLGNYFQSRFTGTTKIDPGNATYLGLLAGGARPRWQTEVTAFCGVKPHQLPPISQSDEPVARMLPAVAKRLGFRKEPVVYVGMMDSSACIAAVEYSCGDLFHISGTTDVLATVTSRPYPSKRYLSRHLGFDGRWLSVRAISGAGATVSWGERLLGIDPLSAGAKKGTKVRFEPYLTGDRMSVEGKVAEFRGLTLATTREELAASIRQALGAEALAGFEDLRSVVARSGHRLTYKVWCSGGNQGFAKYVHGLWRNFLKKKSWQFIRQSDLGMTGLAAMVARKEAL